jgi:hypothetical protein
MADGSLPKEVDERRGNDAAIVEAHEVGDFLWRAHTCGDEAEQCLLNEPQIPIELHIEVDLPHEMRHRGSEDADALEAFGRQVRRTGGHGNTP